MFGWLAVAMGLFSIFSFALLVALWDFHPQMTQELTELRGKLVRMDEFLRRAESQRLAVNPELVCELGANMAKAA